MVINITNNCDEMCSHCMNDSVPHGKHMSMNTLEGIMDFLKEVAPLTVSISGGEFTNHPDFVKIVSNICDSVPNVTRVYLLSNGSFLNSEHKTKDVLFLLKNYDNINSLQIRTDEKYYPNYKKTMANKERLQKLHSKVVVYDGEIDLLPFGRALKNHPESKDTKRKPPCSNLFLVNRQLPYLTLPVFVNVLETQAHVFCKPMISYTGDIHLGETPNCLSIGTVHDKPEDILKKLSSLEPCGKCGLTKNYGEQEKFVIYGK